jgi:hypothetical protein
MAGLVPASHDLFELKKDVEASAIQLSRLR